MDRVEVSSSAINSVGRQDNVLEIEFAAGNISQYQGVPESVYTDLISAPSIGRYFNQFIKNSF